VTGLTKPTAVVLYRRTSDLLDNRRTMYEAAARNLRTAERFLLQPPLSGHFGEAVVSVCDISAKGARFRHGHPLEMGQKSILKLAVEGRPGAASIEAVVVWTQADPSTSGRYLSGVRTYAPADVIDALLLHLQTSHRTTRIEELRSSDRFNLSPLLGGDWNGSPVRIENLSARGARIETSVAAEVGTAAALRFTVPDTPLVAEVQALVVWSSVKAVAPASFRAGLAISEKPELLRLAIGQLCENGRASLDTMSLALKLKVIRARARQLAPSFRNVERSGVPAEQYLLVQCVREELRLNPDEAMHWYRRARLSINDPQTRAAAPAIADHPDALAVWEYLDRSIDPSIIGRTFELPPR